LIVHSVLSPRDSVLFYGFTPEAISAGIGSAILSPFPYFSSSARMASRILFKTVGFCARS
jgi:hypothetical protein